MAFITPNTFVDGSTLDAAELKENNDAARDYVNQGIVASEISAQAFKFDDLQVGDFEAVTSAHRFLTGEVRGLHNTASMIDRSYFTSHVKPGNQTDGNVKVWHPLYECGESITLDERADILINFGATFICEENSRISTAPRRYPSKILLRKYDGVKWSDIEGTRAFCFEEHYDSVTSTTVSISGPSTFLNNVNGYSSDHGVEKTFRRWVGWCWHVDDLAPGTYSFGVFVNAGVEEGFSSARNFTVEVFYK